VRVYAVDDNGARFLRYIACDRCDATIKPYPQIAASGWVCRGERNGSTYYYCPDHAAKLEAMP
jgi:hypothetical protein